LFFLCLRRVSPDKERPMAFSTNFFATTPRPLAALDRTGLEDLFRVWAGASGRGYICSVYPLGEPPAFDCGRAIVAAVRKSAAGAAIVFVFQPSAGDEAEELRGWAQKARQRGTNEWHVHLLADSPAARQFAARDLAPLGSGLPV
jgi:hypothetical protein